MSYIMYMIINHLSVSRDNCFKTCQKQYHFKYHLNVISPEPTPFYFTYGKIVHKIIELYTLGRGKKDINNITKDVLSGKVEIEEGEKAPFLPMEYKNKLPIHLANFMKLTEKIGVNGDVEWHFKYDLDPPNNRYCTGFIDRIIKKDDKIHLIDYKTTKEGPWRKNEFNIIHDLQLQCYCWVVMKEHNLPAKNIKAALYYLSDAQLVPVQFSEKTLLSVPDKLLKSYKEIEELDPDKVKGNVGDWCYRCQWRKLCPFFQGKAK
jgi:CRISPR/Cas system-associated exonuclease Cas4 (RecB family)